ncbi:hypothetical protein PR202_gb16912 [Eleusine coracana subsp. coracana]|uniref:Uncharacterized protein n=1 Tax=Eleusine coracana subsp. coracana TaxID=191504 RepID=A0AAV5F2P1_ELECO|nr:hypothetical protein PR202_gb16912 [Eleusine coracana subsp. coracana]
MAAAATPAPSPRPDMPPPPPPPTTDRRPRRRAREVSSRYLSTPIPATPRLSTASSSAALLHAVALPVSVAAPPRPASRHALRQREPPPPPPPYTGTVGRRRAVQKLFDETGACNPRASVSSVSSAVSTATPRPLPRSTSGPPASIARRSYPRPPTPARAGSCPSAAVPADDAASCCSSGTASTVTDFSEAEGLGVAPAAPCESPPLLGPASCRGGRLSSELRSSVPESCGSARASNPLCYRSLNSALSLSTATAGKVPATAARPPQPQGPKAAELKRTAIIGGRKVAGKQEDVHQLRLMDNRHLQYRFLNASAEVAAKAKTAVAEKSLHGLAEGITGLRNSVAKKRVEVEGLGGSRRLNGYVDYYQMCHIWINGLMSRGIMQAVLEEQQQHCKMPHYGYQSLAMLEQAAQKLKKCLTQQHNCWNRSALFLKIACQRLKKLKLWLLA